MTRNTHRDPVFVLMHVVAAIFVVISMFYFVG